MFSNHLTEMVAIRKSIHMYPEICFQEIKTADLIADKLLSWGIEVHRGIAQTGLVGVIKGVSKGKSIGLRADMDALSLDEENTFQHRSKIDGKMHACGHDGHVAMLLSAAYELASNATFNGTVNLIFQPAEEGGNGAKKMIEDGLFERFPCDAVFALHNWPGIPAGEFATCNGPIMASCNQFKITVNGKGAHAALPHNGIDPIFAAIQIANGLQGVITRNKRPIDSAVLSITQIHSGSTFNIIPDSAYIAGTVRTFSTATLDVIENRMNEVSRLTAKAFECKIEFDFIRQSPPTINNSEQSEFAVRVMEDVVGENKVNGNIEPTMGSEDFSSMLEVVPGCYAFIGNGDGGHREKGHGLGPCMLHNSSYDFNDELIPIGAKYWVHLVHSFFKTME